ncbi:LysM peptidoglycan-binding domain-containing protein [Solicola sp. PLA-1-18]|uniref:LysM peptidoglycan-binding domain-containing protein n=1 Tax=Solicola sp. PLA-1-18 TaxID=3380532 RepID=UPI003B77364D
MSTLTAQRTTIPARPVARRAPLRLTRRGRVVVVLAALVLVALASVFLGSRVVATDEASAPAVAQTVTIQPGQTLWDIARDASPDADPRAVVDDIVELNALTGGGDVQPGQRVAVPAY